MENQGSLPHQEAHYPPDLSMVRRQSPRLMTALRKETHTPTVTKTTRKATKALRRRLRPILLPESSPIDRMCTCRRIRGLKQIKYEGACIMYEPFYVPIRFCLIVDIYKKSPRVDFRELVTEFSGW